RHWRATTSPTPTPTPTPAPTPAAVATHAPPRSSAARGRMKVVAVATSTGGPAALRRLLGGLPGDFPLPILIVQHITPGFTSGLADWLNSVHPMRGQIDRAGAR